MSITFAYTIKGPHRIYYGKYFGAAVEEADLLSLLYPTLAVCYSLQTISEVTLGVVSSDAVAFSERDPFKYEMVYVSSSQLYWKGVQI